MPDVPDVLDAWGDRRLRLLAAMADAGLWPDDSPWVRRAMEAVPRDRFAPETVWRGTGQRYVAVWRAEAPEAWGGEGYPDPYGSSVTQVSDGLPTAS
nr:protein-L-isoaspartate O-methyltransferase [Streptomyces sp. DSM 41633]